MILGAVGRQNQKKGDPKTLTKNHGKKVMPQIPEDPARGGGALKQSSFHPGTS
jgi:hypothetical protein